MPFGASEERVRVDLGGVVVGVSIVAIGHIRDRRQSRRLQAVADRLLDLPKGRVIEIGREVRRIGAVR
jgi:hypothetical protein